MILYRKVKQRKGNKKSQIFCHPLDYKFVVPYNCFSYINSRKIHKRLNLEIFILHLLIEFTV